MNQSNELKQLFSSQPRWRLINEPVAEDPAAALKRDTELLREVAAAKRCATARLWENPQCLVVTRKETRFPNFHQACERLGQEGWPVIVRDSGGTAVPHHPGILNFSLIIPQEQHQTFDLDSYYYALCEPLCMALATLGLTAEHGETKGSYCDGRFNLNIQGLKVTGTAQKIMVSPPNNKGVKQAVLAQAMLMVEADAAQGTAWVNRFYTLAGNERQFDPQVATSIADLLPDTDRKPGQLTLSLRQLIADALNQLIN